MRSSRRTDSHSSQRAGQDRHSSRREGGSSSSSGRMSRSSRGAGGDNQKLIYAGAGVAAVLLLVALAVFSAGPGQAPPPPKKPHVVQQTAPSPIDWYSEGMKRGSDWRARLANRQMRPSADEVQLVAENMTSDYQRKGITSDGEKRFVEGFRKAALGQ